MSASTQSFFALNRQATEAFLTQVISRLDDLTLKNAVHTLVSSYCPIMLHTLVKNEIVPTGLAVPAVPAVPTEPEETEMRTATEENIRRLMKNERIDWEAAWMQLRCKELEDGDSICCTEECSDRSSAEDDLVEAARRGKEKRNARRGAAGRKVSEGEPSEGEPSEGEDSVVKAPYIAPPKIRDAELHWPFMRCKNVANAYKMSMGSSCCYDKIPRNHHGLLEYIASKKKISVETLKKTDPRELFKDNFYVMNALSKSYR